MQIKRKTWMAFVSMIITFLGMAALLALFFSQMWQSADNPLGTDAVTGEMRIKDGNGAEAP